MILGRSSYLVERCHHWHLPFYTPFQDSYYWHRGWTCAICKKSTKKLHFNVWYCIEGHKHMHSDIVCSEACGLLFVSDRYATFGG